MKLKCLTILILIAFTSICFAKADDAVDLWQTYDLKGNARSVIKFYIVNSELRADIIKLNDGYEKLCSKCKGNLKNQPFVGMTIIQGLQFKNNKWINGKVLDGDSGKNYNCQISISKDGSLMKFHVFKGHPVFGRTVQWHRMSKIKLSGGTI